MTKEEAVKKYASGKTPGSIWLFSCLVGAIILGGAQIFLANQQANSFWISGMVHVFFLNLLFSFPLFLFQAHFVFKALRKNRNRGMEVQYVILTIAVIVYAFLNYHYARNSEMNRDETEMLMWFNFSAMTIVWVTLSVFSLKRISKSE